MPIKLAEDTVLYTLFKIPAEPQSEPRGHAKRHRSNHTTETRDDARAMMKEKTDLEAATRASLIDEEARQMRAREMVVGASSSIPVTGEMSTTKGAEIDVCTTESDPSTVAAGSEKSNPPTC